jgi:hypothetical protein
VLAGDNKYVSATAQIIIGHKAMLLAPGMTNMYFTHPKPA